MIEHAALFLYVTEIYEGVMQAETPESYQEPCKLRSNTPEHVFFGVSWNTVFWLVFFLSFLTLSLKVT